MVMAQGGGQISFTDDDLKEFKEHKHTWVRFPTSRLKALIARLEAAEGICQLVGKVDQRNAGDITEVMNKWRLDMNKAFLTGFDPPGNKGRE